MRWWLLRLPAYVLALLRLSVNLFQLRLTKKLKINFFCFNQLNINKPVFFVSLSKIKVLGSSRDEIGYSFEKLLHLIDHTFKYSTSNIILLNLVPRALFLPKPRKSALGTRLCFTHRNVKKQKPTRERPTRGRGATSSYNKNNKILGSSYIYDSKGLFALSLGLINVRGQCVSGHVV